MAKKVEIEEKEGASLARNFAQQCSLRIPLAPERERSSATPSSGGHPRNAPENTPIKAPYELPEGWKWVRLGDVCTIPITDGTHKTPEYTDSEQGIPFISSKDVTKGFIDWSNIKYITQELHSELYARLAPQINDVLLAKNGTTGIAAIVDCDEVFDIYVTLALLRPNKNIILPLYLLDIINSPICKNQFDEHLTGIGVHNLHLRDIKQIIIPLPSIDEQQRIVNLIESLFAKLDEAKEKAQNVVDSFETRKAAILHQAFTGTLTAKWRKENGVPDDSWEEKTIGECCTVVRGGSPRPAGDPKYYDGSIPFMKVADITGSDDKYVYSAQFSIKEAGLHKTRMVEPDTLLLTNSGATLGVPAITKIQTTFNDGIAAFLNLPKESNLFFYYFWTSKTSELRAINMGAAQPNLNTDIIKRIRLLVPSIAEQQEIVRILDTVLEKERTAKSAAEQVLEQIDLLKKSILARAFRGEL